MVLLTGCATLSRPPALDSGRAQRVIELAKTQVGKPYRYGGHTPAGFDCSGLVCYAYQEAAGIKLPHSSRRLYEYCSSVPPGQEAPSDLLFFNIKGSGPSHVGIYLGQGLFVHASDKGDTVKIADGNQAYWRKRLVDVRRVPE